MQKGFGIAVHSDKHVNRLKGSEAIKGIYLAARGLEQRVGTAEKNKIPSRETVNQNSKARMPHCTLNPKLASCKARPKKRVCSSRGTLKVASTTAQHSIPLPGKGNAWIARSGVIRQVTRVRIGHNLIHGGPYNPHSSYTCTGSRRAQLQIQTLELRSSPIS